MTRRLAWIPPAVALAAALSPPSPAAGADGARHLFYLHGRIVQAEQSARPVHPRFGAYELEAILAAFRERGFVVHDGIRPQADTVASAAERTAAEVRALLASGVPADHVTVVGGSMGAAIALEVAARLDEPELRFALLGLCLSESVRGRADRGEPRPAGVLLSIREASDDFTEPCPAWSGESPSNRRLSVRERVLETGLAHGFLYRPLPDWLEPVVAWAETGPTG